MAQPLIRWETTLENAQRLAGQTNRLVLIHFWAPWCTVCKRMETEVFSQPSVVVELGAEYVPVKINADNFPATARQYGVTALPTTVIVSPQGQPLDAMRGRVDANQYLARLIQVAAAVRQRGAAVYARVPAGATPTAGQAATQSAAPIVGQAGSATQPPNAAGASDDRYADFFRRSQAAGGTASLPSGAAQPSNAAGASNDRYANFFRRNQVVPPAMPAAPTAQPSYSSLGPPTAEPPIHAGPSTTATASAMPRQMSPPPSIQPASGPPAYGAVSPPPSIPVSRPVGPPPVSPAPQAPADNPPLCLDGYCPVSLCEKQQWTIGDRRWGAIHRGRTYLFVGPNEQRRFLTDPDRYAPAISGNDIILAAEQGQAVPGMRKHGVFFGNRVYLFSSEASLEKFARNPSAYANQALEALRAGAHPGQRLQ